MLSLLSRGGFWQKMENIVKTRGPDGPEALT